MFLLKRWHSVWLHGTISPLRRWSHSIHPRFDIQRRISTQNSIHHQLFSLCIEKLRYERSISQRYLQISRSWEIFLRYCGWRSSLALQFLGRSSHERPGKSWFGHQNFRLAYGLATSHIGHQCIRDARTCGRGQHHTSETRWIGNWTQATCTWVCNYLQRIRFVNLTNLASNCLGGHGGQLFWPLKTVSFYNIWNLKVEWPPTASEVTEATWQVSSL